MLEHLENGFAWTTLWGVAFMAFSKELVRKIGWWDERFVNGGWEDRDWVWRLKEAEFSHI
jgi:GT2 family glycosyltransferase